MTETIKQATQGKRLHYMFIGGCCHTSLVAHPATSSKHANRCTIQQEIVPTQPNAVVINVVVVVSEVVVVDLIYTYAFSSGTVTTQLLKQLAANCLVVRLW
jgi:hypothetical protein